MPFSSQSGGRAFILLFPALILFVLFTVLPIIYVVQLSLYKTNFVHTTFVGIKNYVKVFQDKHFIQHLTNSFIYTAFLMLGWTLLPLGIALLAYDMHRTMQAYIRFIFYVPVFASGVIISTVWLYILHPIYGLANWAISLLGLSPQMWLGERLLAISTLSTMLITSYMGFYVLVYMASILSIPKEVIDAAKVDGATKWQIKMRIIVPMILPTVLFISLLTMIASLQIWETIFIMNPTSQSYNIMYSIFDSAFLSSKYGFASAKTMILLLLILSLSIGRRYLEKQL